MSHNSENFYNVVLPRPKNPIPIPSSPPPLEAINEKCFKISETDFKKMKWIAYNQGYNDGFCLGHFRGIEKVIFETRISNDLKKKK